MTMFDAIKSADVKTVGNVAVGAGVALGVYEIFGSSKPSYLWPGLLVAGGLAAHVAVMDPKSVTALGQASAGASTASSGAGSATQTTCQRLAAEDLKRQEKEVKYLPYVVTGAALLLGGLALRLL